MRANPAWLAASLSALPLAALLVLWLTGSLAPLPFLATAAVLAAGAFLLAWLWGRDIDRLSRALDRVVVAIDRLPSGEVAAPPRSPALRLAFLRPLGGAVVRLSHRLTAADARLAAVDASDAAIIARLPDPLLVLTADFSVTRVNEAARGAFGADIPAVLRHPTIRAAIDRRLSQGGAETAMVSIPVPIERAVQATVLALDRSQRDRIVIVLSDRTRERAVERTHADFIANASHELRTPLASLIGFIETLRGPAADDLPAQRRFLPIMAGEAARMQRLIEDLLSLSRIELVEHQPPVGRVELGTTLPHLAAGFQPRLAARGMQLHLAVEPDLPEVVADADQLARVVQNLLDNAVKYGREGGVVQLSARVQGDGVALEITDDGPGIPRQHLPRLTERFYRVDNGRASGAGGTGLGLAIVEHIVSRHRGRLLIESEEGKGTTCRVWLPAGRRPASVDEPAGASESAC